MSRPKRSTSDPGAGSSASGIRVLKKYPNRRLYDTQASTYITLADAKQMVMEGASFEVRDAKTGEEITRSILLQIILEEETGGMPIFSTPMLAQLIRFYGNATQAMMGAYLEKNLQAFIDFQQQLAKGPQPVLEGGVFSPESWGQWMQSQFKPASPADIGQFMANYFQQSQSAWSEMQAQWRDQAHKSGSSLFGFPKFGPGSGGADS